MTLFPVDHAVSRDEASRFQITPRVVAILAAVGRFGVLTSEQIARRDGGSRQKVVRLLQRCVEHDLLKRAQPAEPLLTEFFDNRPRPFALTSKAARLLAQAPHPILVTPSRAQVILQHQIDVAETMFAVDAAVAAHGDLRVIDQHLLRQYLPASTRDQKKPFCLRPTVHPADFPQLTHLVRRPMMLPVEPDRLFALLSPDNRARTFALELDRGHEDITAKALNGRATIARKQISYVVSWSQGLHVAQWGEGCKALRILVVTTSEVRIKNMIESQRVILGNRLVGLFAYTTSARIRADGFLSPIWITSERDGVSLIERT